jgi:hypothetical protein
MRPLFAFVAFVGVPLWTTADEPKKPDYYPFTKGCKWEYQVAANGMKIDAAMEVTKSELKDGKRYFTIETKVGDTSTSEELQADDKGIYRTSFNGIATDKPVIIMQYPPKPGTWTQKVKLLGQDLNSTSTAKESVEVKVAAGTFTAIPIEVKAEIAGQTIQGTTWYANGVGIVKQKMDIAGATMELELKKFTHGK